MIKNFCQGTQGSKYVVTNSLTPTDYYPVGTTILPQRAQVYYEKNATTYDGIHADVFSGVEVASNHIPFVQTEEKDYNTYAGM
jgi:hypothetical protein